MKKIRSGLTQLNGSAKVGLWPTTAGLGWAESNPTNKLKKEEEEIRVD